MKIILSIFLIFLFSFKSSRSFSQEQEKEKQGPKLFEHREKEKDKSTDKDDEEESLALLGIDGCEDNTIGRHKQSHAASCGAAVLMVIQNELGKILDSINLYYQQNPGVASAVVRAHRPFSVSNAQDHQHLHGFVAVCG